ncbi:MAG: hypothetical protein JSS49_06165 [Planctomycetes bacterium]|nr:hypothetical protein [Planctomycetota bacterium]
MQKMLTWASVAAAAAFVSLGTVSSAQAQWGSIKGTVTVTGNFEALKPLVRKGDASVKDAAVCAKEEVPDESIVVDPATKGIANVVIWLAKKPTKIHPNLVASKDKEVVFDQKNCKFIPHVLVVRTDQQVRVISDDAASHNTHTYPLKNNQQNFIVPPSDRKGVLVPAFSDAERLPAKVGCDIHPWMQAWWVILDHPYVAVTDEAGKFEIADLPAGEHEFRVWQEKVGYLEKGWKVTVKAGDTKKDADLKVAASKLK